MLSRDQLRAASEFKANEPPFVVKPAREAMSRRDAHRRAVRRGKQALAPCKGHATVQSASRKSERGLDWFTFFVADIQTGFGPFLAVYLTTQKWNQADIGLVLAVGSIAGLVSQLPGGWLVDIVPSKRTAAMVAVAGIGASALLMARVAIVPEHHGWPNCCMSASSSVLGPAIAAITLGLVGHAAVGPRLGRNARFASIGNGLAAGVMGACGYLISPQAVFFVTAALALPTLLALMQIRESEIDPIRADGGISPAPGRAPPGRHRGCCFAIASLITLAACVFLFHAANAAMLPLVGTEMTLRSAQWASALIAACIVVPQLIVATDRARRSDDWRSSKGRRPVLLLGFAALPARAAILAFNSDPAIIVAAQMLDGLCAAVLGVLVPLSLADISRGTGRFNLAQGIVASATGIGAAREHHSGGLSRRIGSERPLAFLGPREHGSSGFRHGPAGDAGNRAQLTNMQAGEPNGGTSSLQCSTDRASDSGASMALENLASYSRPARCLSLCATCAGAAKPTLSSLAAVASAVCVLDCHAICRQAPGRHAVGRHSNV